MQYLPTTVFQAVTFMYSAGLGFTLGIIYDLFRMLFYLLTGSDKKLSVPRDIMFLSVCLASTFIFLLVMCDGQFLLYIFAGEALGLWAYSYSLSAVFIRPSRRVIRKIRGQISKIKKFFSCIKTKIESIFKKINKNTNNCLIFLQKHLHIRHNMVYNHRVKLCPNRILKDRGDGSGKSKEK